MPNLANPWLKLASIRAAVWMVYNDSRRPTRHVHCRHHTRANMSSQGHDISETAIIAPFDVIELVVDDEVIICASLSSPKCLHVVNCVFDTTEAISLNVDSVDLLHNTHSEVNICKT